ncbi:hypothetical protein [Epinotia aporema granulovirus]|uniref:Uncharacterized protein n=1 Tax=Epinotia aporema granulovirus TaxID=166056 RepID=K4EQ14_9BBAC|nr:hypothetical protein [Epinotia aporema granulovirus]AER41442.1 hypothetical protein [Epinotia aporema granulovirus]
MIVIFFVDLKQLWLFALTCRCCTLFCWLGHIQRCEMCGLFRIDMLGHIQRCEMCGLNTCSLFRIELGKMRVL